MRVDQVSIKHSDKSSINYAKCRYAIEEDAGELYKGNVAGQDNFVRTSKGKVLHLLQGKKIGSKVKFNDGSEAKY